MEWISVKDRLPGINSGKLLVVKDGQEPTVAYFFSCGDYYYFCIGNDTKQTWEPSYWMNFNDQPERLSEKTSKEDAIV